MDKKNNKVEDKVSKDLTTDRETVGKISRDLIMNSDTPDHSPYEQMQEQLKYYESNVEEAIKRGLKEHGHTFYVVVLTKKERLMENVIRNYFFTRSTCPTPDWDQAVYRYKNVRGGDVDFLWVVPSKDTCKYLKDNALTIEKSERTLLDFVLDFDSGNLLKMAKRLNGENNNTPFVEK